MSPGRRSTRRYVLGRFVPHRFIRADVGGCAKLTYACGSKDALPDEPPLVTEPTADPIGPNALMPKCLSVSGGTLFVHAGTHEEMLPRANHADHI